MLRSFIPSTNNNVFKLACLIFLICNRGLFGQAGLILFYVICIFLMFRRSPVLPIRKVIIPLIISMIMPVVFGWKRYDFFPIFKDFYYYLSPIFAIIVGQYIAFRRRPTDLINAVRISGIVSAFLMIISAYNAAGFEAFTNPREARVDGFYGANATTLLACAIFWYEILYVSKAKKTKTFLLFVLTTFGVYLSGTRTLWVSEIIFLIVVGWNYYKRHVMRTIAVGTICAIAVSAVIVMNPKNRMVIMLLHSSDEMTITNHYSQEQRVNNYRGYESAMAMNYFRTFPVEEKLVGHGFGSTIDVKYSGLVGFRYVPITHNGYPYLLVKSGLLGLLMFILWGVYTIYLCSTSNADGFVLKKLYKPLCVAIVLMVFVTNQTVNTYVNAFYNSSLMIVGAFLYYTYKPIRCKYQS